MIDPNLPLELDDGTPVILRSRDGGSLYVTIPKSPYRNERGFKGSYYYYESSGIYVGGSAKNYFVLRNVFDAPHEPEDWS